MGKSWKALPTTCTLISWDGKELQILSRFFFLSMQWFQLVLQLHHSLLAKLRLRVWGWSNKTEIALKTFSAHALWHKEPERESCLNTISVYSSVMRSSTPTLYLIHLARRMHRPPRTIDNGTRKRYTLVYTVI